MWSVGVAFVPEPVLSLCDIIIWCCMKMSINGHVGLVSGRGGQPEMVTLLTWS